MYIILAVILAFPLTLLSFLRTEHFDYVDIILDHYGFPVPYLIDVNLTVWGGGGRRFDYFGFAIDIIFWFCIVLLGLGVFRISPWIFRKVKLKLVKSK